MNLTVSNDQYHVHWNTHMDQGIEAMLWCHNSFGQGWGYKTVRPDLQYHAEHRFTFYKLYHAQWFMAKWTA